MPTTKPGSMPPTTMPGTMPPTTMTWTNIPTTQMPTKMPPGPGMPPGFKICVEIMFGPHGPMVNPTGAPWTSPGPCTTPMPTSPGPWTTPRK